MVIHSSAVGLVGMAVPRYFQSAELVIFRCERMFLGFLMICCFITTNALDCLGLSEYLFVVLAKQPYIAARFGLNDSLRQACGALGIAVELPWSGC
jgi:hypothetical protein